MDVTMPDGTVVNNVPDDMSKSDFVAKAKANGAWNPSWDAPQKSQNPGSDDQPGILESGLKGFAKGVIGSAKSLKTTAVGDALHPENDAPEGEPDSVDKLMADPNWWHHGAGWAAKIGAGLGGVAPGMGAAALASAPFGGPEDPLGAAAGTAAWAGVSAMQELPEAYRRNLKNGDDAETAYNKAWKDSGIAAATGALMNIVPGMKAFKGAADATGKISADEAAKAYLKNLVFHTFGTGPAMGAAQDIAQSEVDTGKAPDAQDLALNAAVMGLTGGVQAAIHHGVAKVLPQKAATEGTPNKEVPPPATTGHYVEPTVTGGFQVFGPDQQPVANGLHKTEDLAAAHANSLNAAATEPANTPVDQAAAVQRQGDQQLEGALAQETGDELPPDVPPAVPNGPSLSGLNKPKEPTATGGDEQQTVSEPNATLLHQQKQLQDGLRPAQYFPNETTPLPLPDGMQEVKTDRGVFHINPKLTSEEEVHQKAAEGRIGDLLNLGPYNKDDINNRVATGEQPVAVTERTPDGTEVRAAHGTGQTAAEQAAYFEQTKTPGNTIAVEHPLETVAKRIENAQAAPPAESESPQTPAAPSVESGATPPIDEKTPGTRKNPIDVKTAEDLRAAEENIDHEPTPAQKTASNYEHGHIRLHGLDIGLENGKGSKRTGIGEDGRKWTAAMKAAYGYVKGTIGKDKDHVDAFIGDHVESDKAFIIDQKNLATGEFDEHKVVLGARDEAEAHKIYDGSFSDEEGPARRMATTEVPIHDLKEWLANKSKTQEEAAPHFAEKAEIEAAKEKLKAAISRHPASTIFKIKDAIAATGLDSATARSLLKEVAEEAGLENKSGSFFTSKAGEKLSAFSAVPNPPRRLSTWIKSKGGIKNEGEELTNAIRQRPGLVNNKTGMTHEDAALAAWQAGYFPEHGSPKEDGTPPDISAFLKRLDEDIRGNKQFSEHDTEELEAFNDAISRNEEISKLADEHDIPTSGLTQAEFYDKLRESMSLRDMARLQKEQEDSHLAAMAEAEARQKEWMDQRGEAWEPDWEPKGRPRTLKDLQDEYEREELARRASEGEGSPDASESGSSDASEEGAGSRERSSGDQGGNEDLRNKSIGDAIGLTSEAIAAADKAAKAEADKASKLEQHKLEKSQSKLRKSGQKSAESQKDGLFAKAAEGDQGDLLSQPKPKAEWGSANKLVSTERAEAIREALRAKMRSQISSGLDPETIMLGTELAVYHIEAGARSFADFAGRMIADLGDKIRPFLKMWYNAARDYPGMDDTGMTPYEEVRKFDHNGEFNVPDLSGDLERDSGNAEIGDSVGKPDVQSKGDRATQGSGRGDERAEEGRVRPDSDIGISPDGTASVGEGGDSEVQAEASGARQRAAERGGQPGGYDVGEHGPAIIHIGAESVGKTAGDSPELAKKEAAQAKANKLEVKPGLNNIRETLPYLLPGQHDDIHKAEQRFAKPDGHGMLFSNGTGTGKTFTGGGIIARFVRQGKGDILIVAPSQGIVADWQKALAKIGIESSVLESTTTAGKGVVLATYANLGENRHLADRNWHLVVADESQKLMANENGEPTGALNHFRAITNHPDGLSTKANMQLRDLNDRLDEVTAIAQGKKPPTPEMSREKASELSSELNRELNKKRNDLIDKFSQEPRSKAVFLSATPLPYVKAIDYANGYLFHYPKVEKTGAYNQADGRGQFLMENFGYRMRTGKLTEPDSNVDSGIMERAFHEKLKREGSLSTRRLDVDADYDRKFVLVNDAVGHKIDSLMEFLREADNGKFRHIAEIVNENFDYLSRMRLLEAIKANHFVPIIKKHIEMGRKVVVFHDYNEGGGMNPFDLSNVPNAEVPLRVNGKDEMVNLQDLAREFHDRNPEAKKMDFSQFKAPIETMRDAFPAALFYNGNVPEKARAQAKMLFNQDGSGRDIIVVNSAAGEAGISLHDTTGAHQRVLINLGMPIKPTTAIQEEGRIYRTGQVTDALFRYGNTGTNWERWTFAGKIADRAGTAENLAMGNEARALKEAFINAFNDSDEYSPSKDEGKGGKESDRSGAAEMSEFDRAKSYYWAQQKKTGRRDQREGIDYFPTPEPIGQKMVEWADIKPGDKVLEPSAGHGAIARWFPEHSDRTLIEPSGELASRAALASPGAKVLDHNFEDLHKVNKYDAIVMNPPFGQGGKTAIDHLALAASHIREGGRIVALLPDGPAANKRLADFLVEHNYLHDVGVIKLPESVFEKAGTAVRTHVVVLEKHSDHNSMADGPGKFEGSAIHTDKSNAKDIKELFDRIEHVSLPGRIEPTVKEVESVPDAKGNISAGGHDYVLSTAQNGDFLVKPKKYLADDYHRINALAKENNGGYGKDDKSFRFKTESDRSEFLKALASGAEPKPSQTAGFGVDFEKAQAVHSKTGKDLFVAIPQSRVETDKFHQMNALAKQFDGAYSAWKGKGAVPGFQFPSEAAREAFINAATEEKIGPRGAADNDEMPDITPHQEARGEVLKRGESDGNEHNAFVDREGKIIYETSGKNDSVEFSNAILKRLMDQKESITIHHNHPSNRPLSQQDFLLLSYPGIDHVVAHGDGVMSSATLTELGRSIVGTGASSHADWEKIVRKVKRDVDESLFSAYEAGEIGSVPTMSEQRMALGQALHQSGLIEYHSTHDVARGEPAFNYAVDSGVTGAISSVKRLKKPTAEMEDDRLHRSTWTGSVDDGIADLPSKTEKNGSDGQGGKSGFGGHRFDDQAQSQIDQDRSATGSLNGLAGGSEPVEKPDGQKGGPNPRGTSDSDELTETQRTNRQQVAQKIKEGVEEHKESAKTLWKAIQMICAPMATGTDKGKVIAKQFANSIRDGLYRMNQTIDMLAKGFSPEQLGNMWRALDDTCVRHSMEERDFIAENINRIQAKMAEKWIERGMPEDEAMEKVFPAAMEAAKIEARGELEKREKAMAEEKFGIFSLPDDQRDIVMDLSKQADQLWKEALNANLVSGQGLPRWTPRMLAMVSDEGHFEPIQGDPAKQRAYHLDVLGTNATTVAPSLRSRKYMTKEEQNEAGARMRDELGFNGDIKVLEDIRTMPLAMGRIQHAVTTRTLINKLDSMGKAMGLELVKEGHEGGDHFTVNHPAFSIMKPMLEWKPISKEDLEDRGNFVHDGKVYKGDPDDVENASLLKSYRVKGDEIQQHAPVTRESDGSTVMQAVPISIHRSFEGPLRAILTSKPGPIYQAVMRLKATVTHMVLLFPTVHLGMELGRALPTLGGKMFTVSFWKQALQDMGDKEFMSYAIQHGMDPIGSFYEHQDISTLSYDKGLMPGKSPPAKLLGLAGDLVSKEFGNALRKGADKFGDFYTNTLLWNRVRQLQVGLFRSTMEAETQHLAKKIMAQDPTVTLDEAREKAKTAAAWMAGNVSNRYAGALPLESMGEPARKFCNIMLFSRMLTVGNWGAMKDMFHGMPGDVYSSIKQACGENVADLAKSAGKRKALAAFAIDIGMMYAMNAGLQSAFSILNKDKTEDEEVQGYIDRYHAAINDVGNDPSLLLDPTFMIERISPTFDNDVGAENRFKFGKNIEGADMYGRSPFGKIGEDLLGAISHPLKMMGNKMSTLARPIISTITNADPFTHDAIYDEDAQGVWANAKVVGDVVKYFMEQQLPSQEIDSVSSWIQGGDDAHDSMIKSVLPILGITTRTGNSGGPSASVAAQVKREHDRTVKNARREVSKDIRAGNLDKAIDYLSEHGMTSEQATKYVLSRGKPKDYTAAQRKLVSEYGTDLQKERADEADQ